MIFNETNTMNVKSVRGRIFYIFRLETGWGWGWLLAEKGSGGAFDPHWVDFCKLY